MKKTAWLSATALVSIAIFAVPSSAAARDDVIHTHYDGVTNDLLTAGLGKDGLGSATPPGFADPLNPTVEELRRLAIYNNYRALIDPTPGGGYGTLYGPNVKADGTVTAEQGKIAGDEYITFEKGSHDQNVTMMVQIPDSFDPANACIVAAPSSGSRGVYGAIATAGEWGLKHGCAVAYTDKGTGTGAHDLQNNTVNLIRGERADAAAAGDDSNFTADIKASERAAFNAAWPNRFAFKHAHSQQNPEKDWGRHTLQAIEFAFFVLNEKFGDRHHERPIKRSNTIVIASSASNGAGAAIAAAEQDKEGLIDGVAVSEPQIQPRQAHGLAIQRGSNPPFNGGGKALYDYFTLANMLQPCARLAPSVADSPGIALVNATLAANRCAALKAKGVLSASSTTDQANEALAMLRGAGWEPESNLLHA